MDSLTETPKTFCTKRHLSFRETVGHCSTSASSNLLARSSSLGCEPGCLSGATACLPGRYRRSV